MDFVLDGIVLPTLVLFIHLKQNRRFAVVTLEDVMLGWAITFLIVALIAALLGFGGIAGTAVEIAKLIFFVAIILFAISAVVALVRGRTPTVQ
jgi:uncharacterized membrane protein YtjA (UPF0391 family)